MDENDEALIEGAIAGGLALLVAHRADAWIKRTRGKAAARKFWLASGASQLGGITLFFLGWFWGPLYSLLLVRGSGVWLTVIFAALAWPYFAAYVFAAKQYRWLRRRHYR